MTMSEISDDLVDWMGPIEIPALTAKKIDFQKRISNDLKINKLEISNKKITIQFAEKGGIENIFSKKHNYIKNNKEFFFGVPVLEYPKTQKRTEIFKPVASGSLDWSSSWNKKWKNIKENAKLKERKFFKKKNYISVEEEFYLSNGDKFKTNYKLFTNQSSLIINVEIMKKPDSNPHALYLTNANKFRKKYKMSFRNWRSNT